QLRPSRSPFFPYTPLFRSRYLITRRQGTVRFAAPVAVVSERLIPETGSWEAIDEHTCRYVTAPDSWEWLAIILAMVDLPYTIEGDRKSTRLNSSHVSISYA